MAPPVKSYRHDLRVYFLVPVVMTMVAYFSVDILRFEGELRGGELMRYGFAAFGFMFVIAVGYLFLRFAIVRYYVVDEGLMVCGLFSKVVRAWDELCPPRYHRGIKAFSVRDSSGHLILFSSVDYFSNVQEFFALLQQQAKARPPSGD
ncbi:MAG: hypothetical protein QG602_2501 [Verrucomicrobiota bacterium]|nr:hypothetical protein [Verrucomicrobiota bacterium]